MSPRGVATPDVRETLYQAAERVLERDGPDGLTSRAVTEEAGVARGLLFNHFSDFDRFLAELILDRTGAATDGAAELPPRAASGTVRGNLVDAAVSLLRSPAFAMAGMIHARPALMARLHEVSEGRPYNVLANIESSYAAYLAAEKKRGRISNDVDTGTIAFVLLGTVHHIFMIGLATSADLRERIEHVIDVLLPA
jgi:AcrR family transcriptional regulator